MQYTCTVLRTGFVLQVHPYTEPLVRSDAFRGPLATAFKLHLSDIAEYYDR